MQLKPDPLTSAVIDAINRAPVSLRSLGRAGGVPQPSLSRIVNGQRRATEAVARSVMTALRELGKECEVAASRIEKVVSRHRAGG